MAASDRDILPDTVKPINYALSLYDLELGGSYSYQGTVKINLDVRKSTQEIVLNAMELKIHTAEVITEHTKTEQRIEASNISYDEKAQRATIKLVDSLPASSKATMTIKFSGIMNDVMRGFYRSKYKPVVPAIASVPKDDEYHYMFSTDLEPCEARRAFPCFDEPNLKATFELELEIPEDLVGLSNMPEKEVKQAKKSGLKIVSFERSPIMSTYLLCWAFGDFEYVEEFTRKKYGGKNLPVRVYTTRGLKEQGRFAVQHAAKVVDYFSEVFRIDYPLPKVDLLAVHDLSYGAMENWGLITYRTTAILFDEATSDPNYKNRVAYVVSHELAHQWFGNLVTMDWWSELWLNEGFATWVGWLAVDHFYPDWNIWGQFVTESVQSGLQLDSLRGSHPIEVPVRDAVDVDQIFDAISYLKGGSVIRMLSAHLGLETFFLGVSNYLKAHSYGNATTNDLWNALSDASGKDITKFMDDWIRKIGFPVVTVTEEPGQIGVRQSRFLLTGDVKPEEDETTWWIPLGIRTGSDATTVRTEALTAKQETIRNVNDDFYKLNANQTGFYRTNYPAERLMKLGASRDKLTVEDRIGLIGDIAALAVSGNGTTAGLLSFLEGYQSEENYLVWAQAANSLANIRSIFADHEQVTKGLKKFTLKLVSPAAEKVRWEFSPDDDFLTIQLRSLLITTAGGAGHQEIISEAQRRFKLYTSGEDKTAVHPSMRLAIFRIVIAEGGRSEFEAVKNEYLHTSSVDGKEICLQALGRLQSPDLINEFLDFVFSDQVKLQDKHTGPASLAANPKARVGLWQYFKLNWEKVHGQMSENPLSLDRLLKMSLNKFASHEVERDIAEFFKGKDNRGYARTLGVIADTIRSNANYKDRDEKLVLEWLTVHGYA